MLCVDFPGAQPHAEDLQGHPDQVGVAGAFKEIVECVKVLDHRGRTVRTCWIAEVKRKLGLTTRVAWRQWVAALP